MTDHGEAARPRTAVVTGASQGIGAAVAQRLSADGYRVWAVARRADELRRLAQAQPEGRIVPVAADITTDIAALETELAGIPGGIDLLVHCVGFIQSGPVRDLASEDFQHALEVNVAAPLQVTRAALPFLGPASTIVFVNSSQGLSASAGVAAYAASKHALKAVADSLRQELGGRGIRVTSLYPGRTATPMQEALYRERSDPYRPELLLQAETIAQLVATIAGLSADAEVTDLSIRPALKSY